MKSELSVRGLFLETFCRNIRYFQKTNLISFSYLQLILTTRFKCMVHPSRKLLRKYYLQLCNPIVQIRALRRKEEIMNNQIKIKKIKAEISKPETSFLKAKGFRNNSNHSINVLHFLLPTRSEKSFNSKDSL